MAELPAARAARYGLVSAWGLADLTDSYGSNTLTNNGGATFGAGQLGNAVYLDRTVPQWLSLSGDPGLGDVDFMVAAWVWLDSLTGLQTAVAKANGGGTQFAHDLYYNGSFLSFYAENASDTSEVAATTFGAPSTGAWHLAMGDHDAVNDLISISVNGGPWDSAAHAGGVRGSNFPVYIGAYGTVGSEPLGGRLDGAYFFKSPPGGIAGLQDEIRDYLWNGGAGRQYPEDWGAGASHRLAATAAMVKPGARAVDRSQVLAS